MSDRPSLSRQISAMQAELKLRREETAMEIRRGRMKDSERDFIIGSLEAVIDTLRAIPRDQELRPHRLSVLSEMTQDNVPTAGLGLYVEIASTAEAERVYRDALRDLSRIVSEEQAAGLLLTIVRLCEPALTEALNGRL